MVNVGQFIRPMDLIGNGDNGDFKQDFFLSLWIREMISCLFQDFQWNIFHVDGFFRPAAWGHISSKQMRWKTGQNGRVGDENNAIFTPVYH